MEKTLNDCAISDEKNVSTGRLPEFVKGSKENNLEEKGENKRKKRKKSRINAELMGDVGIEG
jgi:hypothetical protein